MPITNNNIRNVTKKTNNALSWVVLVWCTVIIICSIIMLILGNEVFHKSNVDTHGIRQVSFSRFKRKRVRTGTEYAPGPAPTHDSLFYNILSKMTLRNYNVGVTCLLVSHVIAALVILGRM